MATLNWPGLPVKSISWSLTQPSQQNVSAWTGKRSIMSDPWHGAWSAKVTLAAIVREANVLALRSFLAKLKGGINTFHLPAAEAPQNNNSGVTVSTTAAAGAETMDLAGATTALKEGQFVNVNGQLLQLTAAQSGSTITFLPKLRSAATAGTAVETAKPYALVYLASSDSGWSVDPGQVYSAGFDVAEAVGETDGADPAGDIWGSVAITGTSGISSPNDLVLALAGTTGAAMIGCVAPGAGATQRSVQNKLRDLSSLKDYNAVGNGIADDSGAEAATRLALQNNGGGILIRPAASGYLIGGVVRRPGMLVLDPDFPAFSGTEPHSSLAVYARNNGTGSIGRAGIYSFMVNGTGNATPFTTIGGTDSVALSAVVFTGTTAPYAVCAANIVSRFAGAPPGINWGLEIDINNEVTSTYTAGDPRYGQGVVLNTGSTYSPDTAIVIQRAAGEGTGPGWKQGIFIRGVRDTGIIIEAMSPTSVGTISPAATSTITALAIHVGGDAQHRFYMDQAGAMHWGSGSAAADVSLSRGSAALSCSGAFGATQYFVGANQVVGPRITGWGAASGGSKAAFNSATATLAQTSAALAQLIADITTHGLISA